MENRATFHHRTMEIKDFHALFTFGGLEPDVYICWQVSFGVRTNSELALSPFTPAVCSS